MKSTFKKIMRYLFLSLAWFVGFLLLVLVAIVLKPQLVVNATTLKVGLQAASVAGLQSRYKKADIHIASDNFLRKKLFIHFDDLCINSTSGSLSGCFSEISLNVKVQIQKPFFKLVEFGPTVLASQKFHLDITPAESVDDSPPSHFLDDILPQDLSRLRIYPIEVRMQDVDIKSGRNHFVGQVHLSDKKTLSNQGPWQLKLVADVEEKTEEGAKKSDQDLKAMADFTFSGQRQILAGPVTVKSFLAVTTPLTKPLRAQLDGEVFGTQGGFKLRVISKTACLESELVPVSGCLSDVDVGVTGLYTDQGLSLQSLTPLKLSSSQLKVELSGRPKKRAVSKIAKPASGAEKEEAFNFVRPLLGLRFGDVKVQLPKVTLVSGGDRIQSSLLFNSAGPKAFDLNIKLDQNDKTGVAKLSAYANLKATQNQNAYLISGPLGLKSGDLRVETRVNTQLTSQALEFSIDALFEQKPWGAHAFIRGDFNGQNLKGGISQLGAHNDSLIFTGPAKDPCLFDFELEKRSQFECNISLKFTEAQIARIMGERALNLKMDLTTKFPPGDASPWSGYVSLKIPLLKNEMISASGEVRALFENTKFDNELLKNINLRNDLDIEIADFAAWVNKTYSTSFAVPAPLNGLKGKVSLNSHGTLKGITSVLPLHFDTDLHGNNQAFVVAGEGTLGVVSKKSGYVPELKAVVMFNDVQLILPRLSVAAPPPLIPDSRITTMKEVREAKKISAPANPGFLYEIQLKTKTTQPVYLISNLAQAPIPIALDLGIKTVEGLRGKIGIEKFPVELFAHKAQIVKLNLQLVSARLEENIIDGEATVAVNDYTIFIDLSGNPKAPVVRFHSEPPLPTDQIVPVVLFGKTPESLDVDQKNSSSNFQSALQDQALPLASFFFLASTPIESVGYDSQQKIFTAKLRIRQGLSLDVGSNGSQVNQLGLNKRLGKSWSIRTYVTNPTDQNQPQSVTAFLEKLFQY